MQIVSNFKIAKYDSSIATAKMNGHIKHIIMKGDKILSGNQLIHLQIYDMWYQNIMALFSYT